MTSSQAIEARASRVRQIVAGVTAVLVVASVLAVGFSRFASADEDELKERKQELHETKDRYRAQMRKIRARQRVMNRLATRISLAEDEILRTETRIDKLQRHMRELEVRAALLQAKIDERGREAYMSGGATPILYLLTATSTADAAARMGFLTEMNRRDAALAVKVQETTDRVAQIEAELVRGRRILALRKRSLEIDRKELQRKMAESRRLVASLRGRIEQIQNEISRIRPFAVCPMGGPHAIADNFGDLRHEPGGGTHIHQGDDITAASGTSILAPFDGVASASHSALGGLGVYVHGDHGFVYNAHLSRLGGLGPVEAGEVVGYVGSTGHSTGPHNHFEWHPGNGPAVDPYEYLMLACRAPL